MQFQRLYPTTILTFVAANVSSAAVSDRMDATDMKTTKHKATSARQIDHRRARAEKQAVKKFNTELQKAVDRVDWGKVTLPRQRCWGGIGR